MKSAHHCPALRRRRLYALAFAAILLTPGAWAKHPCTSIAEPAQRLACFDRLHPASASDAASATDAAAAGGAGPAVAPTASTRPLATRSPAVQAARFGLVPDASERAEEIDSISASVREVSSMRHGERVFVLDNGQRWAERSAESRGPVRAGDRVTVSRAAFGSFMLVTPAGVGLRVRRLP